MPFAPIKSDCILLEIFYTENICYQKNLLISLGDYDRNICLWQWYNLAFVSEIENILYIYENISLISCFYRQLLMVFIILLLIFYKYNGFYKIIL